jgi:glucosamine--fructose-6-phosphate aminotransferase (isomerizing)
MTGGYAAAFSSGEAWLDPQSVFPERGRTLLVASSRSGETTELINACQRFKDEGRGELLTLTCTPGKPLVGMGAWGLVLEEAQEGSVSQTRAFSSLYLAANALIALWADRNDVLDRLEAIPAIARGLLRDDARLAAGVGRDLRFDHFFFLGSGMRYGMARELTLKMEEMALTGSENHHFMEYRHGPRALVDEKTVVVGLLSESGYDYECAVLDDARQLGAQVVSIGERGADVVFSSGLDEWLQGVLYLPVGQLIAYERAMALGLDPDHPRNLNPVVKLE